MADLESENFRKLFIGGLHYETTDESLQAFYSQWGEVVDCIVMKDSMTKRSRGFGFVTFARSHMVDEALKAKPHVVDGKQVDPKRATPKEEAGNPVARAPVKKVFVGGLREVTENSDLVSYFSQFGSVVSADIAMDKTTGRKRGFAFVSFEDCDSVDKCALIHNHTINGNPCEVKKAVERDGSSGPMPRGGGRGGPRGGGAPMRGGRGAANGGGAGYSPYPAAGGARYGAYGSPAADYGAGAAGYGANSYGAGAYGAPAAGGWDQSAQYGNGYGAGFGAGYGNSDGGGAMKTPGSYAARSAAPYAATGGYGGATAAYASPYGAATGGYGAAGAYGGAGAYGAYGQS